MLTGRRIVSTTEATSYVGGACILRCCRLAILIEIGWNPCSHVVQQRGRPSGAWTA